MSQTSASSPRQLAAEAGIRRTLARYCHTIDDGDFAALAECFAPDAELLAFGRTRSGREAVTALLAKAMPPENRGKHLTCNTHIGEVMAGEQTAGEQTAGEQTGAATAAQASQQASAGDSGGARVSVLSDFAFVGRDGSITTGRYRDEFIAAQGGWMIARREIAIGG